MITDYYNRFYNKLYERSLILRDNDYAEATRINKWKKHLASLWSGIELTSLETVLPKENTKTGDSITVKIKLFLNGIDPEDIRLELLLTEAYSNNYALAGIEEGTLIPLGNDTYESTITTRIEDPGTLKYTIRVMPYNPLLPYKADFNVVKWL
jgi:starch phosphorylase